jgi:hypothetical protein
VAKAVLSPIALAVRDQTTLAARAADPERIQMVCQEMLEASGAEIELDSEEMKRVVASVVQGVLASIGTARAEVIEFTMHAVARFASAREGTDPNVVAAVICDAASVIEVAEEERQAYLDSMIEAVLAACDHILGRERDEFADFLRRTLPLFLERRQARPANDQPDTPARHPLIASPSSLRPRTQHRKQRNERHVRVSHKRSHTVTTEKSNTNDKAQSSNAHNAATKTEHDKQPGEHNKPEMNKKMGDRNDADANKKHEPTNKPGDRHQPTGQTKR